MSSRVERHFARKLEKKQRRYKRTVTVLALAILLGGLYIVDTSFGELMCIENKKIFDYALLDDRCNIHLFGQDYFLMKEEIANVKKDINSNILNLMDSINDYKNKIMKSLKTR